MCTYQREKEVYHQREELASPHAFPYKSPALLGSVLTKSPMALLRLQITFHDKAERERGLHTIDPDQGLWRSIQQFDPDT